MLWLAALAAIAWVAPGYVPEGEITFDPDAVWASISVGLLAFLAYVAAKGVARRCNGGDRHADG